MERMKKKQAQSTTHPASFIDFTGPYPKPLQVVERPTIGALHYILRAPNEVSALWEIKCLVTGIRLPDYAKRSVDWGGPFDVKKMAEKVKNYLNKPIKEAYPKIYSKKTRTKKTRDDKRNAFDGG